MNKIYKVIWSKAKNCYVVASELEKCVTKSASSRRMLALLVTLSVLGGCNIAGAEEDNSNVVNGTKGGIQSNTYTEGSGAVTGGTASGVMSVALGKETTASGDYSTALGESSSAIGEASVAIGSQNSASGDYSTALGESSLAIGEASVAIGANTKASGAYSTALGYESEAYGANSLAVLGGTTGADGATTGLGAVAIGSGSLATGENAIALGGTAKAELDNSVALGTGSVAIAAAAGYDPSTNAASSDTSTTWTATNASVAIGDGTTVTRQLTGVAAGANATDAVNVAQLKAVNEKIGTLTGSDYLAIQTTNTVSQNLEALDSQVKTNADAITTNTSDISTLKTDVAGVKTDVKANTTNIAANAAAIAQETTAREAADQQLRDDIAESVTTKSLTADKAYDNSTKDGNYVKAANSIGDNLNALDVGLQNAAAADNQLNQRIDETNDRVDRVGAGAAALAALHPQAMRKGESQIMAGMGHYKGKSGAAVGFAWQPDKNLMVDGGFADAAGEMMFNVGLSYKFGQKAYTAEELKALQGGQGISLNMAEMKSELTSRDLQINELKADNAAMKADNVAMQAHNAAMQADNDAMRAHNAAMQAHNAAMQADNAAMKAELAELKAMVAELARKK